MHKIINGDNIAVLKTYPDNHFDSIVTDPPYLISFLGKDWDKPTDQTDLWRECLRVLKPGGHLLSFSAPRTYHKIATFIENAGFEIRDQITWIFASGFPKSLDMGKAIQKRKGVKETTPYKENHLRVGGDGNHASYKKNRDAGEVMCTDPEAKQWEGWKTALKPAMEPICCARKPMNQSCVANVLEHGTGALNIDASRIPYADDTDKEKIKKYFDAGMGPGMTAYKKLDGSMGRHDKFEASDIDQSKYFGDKGRYPSNVIGEITENQKPYFYCSKVSRKERHIGFDTDKIPTNPDGMYDDNKMYNEKKQLENIVDSNSHPTVKPVALMRYLVKLVTPPGGKVLDPFCGSGSTGMAAVELGHHFTGIELDPKYCEISKIRIEAWNKPEDDGTTFNEIFN